jgi:hypothetical protein
MLAPPAVITPLLRKDRALVSWRAQSRQHSMLRAAHFLETPLRASSGSGKAGPPRLVATNRSWDRRIPPSLDNRCRSTTEPDHLSSTDQFHREW